MRPKEGDKARIDIRVPARLKAELEKMWEEDPRTFRSLSGYASFLLQEAVVRLADAGRVAKGQRAGAARAAERRERKVSVRG